MEKELSLLRRDKWRIIDQSGLGPHFQAIQSFAMDDTLCMSVGSGHSPATMRSWVHHNTVVLGIQDTKLPGLGTGIEYLESQGYNWVVRNSGGLAVMLDEGVLNLSLLFPDTEKGIDINRGYDSMWNLVRMMFEEFGMEIEAKEIVGSYCPGSYDLSIGGKKFAGISQRRIRKGVAVQIYLCVSGSGQERAQLIRDFYHHARFRDPSKFHFPDVRPHVMASLSELLAQELTISDVMLRCLTALKQLGGLLYAQPLDSTETEWYEGYYARMLERNRKLVY